MSPGRIRLEDLPPEVAAKIAGRTGRTRKTWGRVTRADRSNRWRCHNCGATFTAYAPAERHANQPGHRRIEALI